MCVVVVDLLREDEQDVVLAIDVVDSLVYSLYRNFPFRYLNNLIFINTHFHYCKLSLSLTSIG